MKVIKSGNTTPKTANVTCYRCHAVLEITKNDLVEDEKDWDALPTTWRYICPCCKLDNHIGFDIAHLTFGFE